MTESSNADISTLVKRLEEVAPKDGAIIKFQQYGGGLDEESLLGTRAGYLKLGTAMLQIGLAASSDKPKEISIDLSSLQHGASNVFLESFVLDNQIEQFERPTGDDPHPTRILPPRIVLFAFQAAFVLLGFVGIYDLLKGHK